MKLSIRDADIGKVHNQVKSPWFLEINPNGRIPAITHNGQRVFETSAILIYLAQVFDKERKFSQDPTKNIGAWAEEQSWIFFAVSNLLRSLLIEMACIDIVCLLAWRTWSHARPGQPLQCLCT